MIRITLTKISDCENPHIADHILPGRQVEGWLQNEPKVGEPFWVTYSYRTSLVTEVIDQDNFKTMNSIYKITRHEEQSAG